MGDTAGRAGLDSRVLSLAPGLDVLSLPACILDPEMRYVYVNAGYQAMSGRTRAQCLGRTPDEVFDHTPRDERRVHLKRALAGESSVFTRRSLEGPGAGRWVSAHYFPLRGEASEVVGALVVLVDVQQLKDAEAALADRERKLSLIIDSVGFPITYVDRGYVIRFANRPSREWSSRTAEAMIGQPIEAVMTPEVREAALPLIERALQGEPVTYEREALWPGREQRHIRGHMIPDRDSSGAVMGVLIVLLDIEQDHQLRRAVEAKEAQLRQFAENIPGPIAVVDRDFRYVFANKIFQESRGVALESIMGRRVDELLGPTAAAKYFAPYAERLRRGETCTHERLVGAPGRAERWHLVQLAPIMLTLEDGTRRFNGYYIVSSDIHDIKLAQERLAAQEAQLRLYTDNIPDSVAYLDRNRRFLFANRHFAEQRGTTVDQIIGRNTEEVLGRELSTWVAERTQRVIDRAEPAAYERILTMPDGEKRWSHVKAVPHVSDDGQVIGIYVVSHDITEVKRAQEQLAASEEELRFFAENIPEAIAYVDLERGCTFVNNLYLASRGLKRELALGQRPEHVFPADVMEELRPHIERVVAGEEATYERFVKTPQGDERWVRVRLTPRRDADGRVRGYYAVSTDIHDLKSVQEQLADKERQLRHVIDSIPTPMCYVDGAECYRYVNDAFLAYIGLPSERIVGQPVRSVLGDERWQLLKPHLERVRAGEPLAVERLVKFADGRKRWMIVRLTPRLVAGRYEGYYATTSDIDEQKAIEDELRRTNTILSAHFDNTPLAVIEWDTELRIVRWSGQAEAIFGWNAAEVLGRTLHGWRHVYEEDAAAATRMIRDLVEGPERHATLRHRNYRKDGSVIWVEWHNSALRDESGRVISILSLAQDVSSRIQAEERLQYMATHDGLTGLPNSVLLHDRLEAALSRARRARRRVGVMFLDLDHFKDVNDTLGHRVGDALLKELARRIRAALRQSDVLARISGDEFVVVLEDLPDEGAPERVARIILEEVRRPFQVEGNDIHVSGSLGLAIHPDDGTDAETLLKNADAAMYHAKELGRNTFRLFSAELAQRRAQRIQVETALRRALKNDELELHYQPIVDTSTGAVRSVEALLRWHDPERGLMLPAGFIPLAEESGLGHAIGHWVMEAASRQARAWHDAGVALAVSVNLSAGQLRDTSMVGDLKRVLARTGCEPGWLQLEITETSMVRDVEGASVVLAKLRTLGVRVAIDDFGTGFSSLSHLRHLPVDVLKIDKAFVADIDAPRKRGENAGGAAIASAVIGLARGLGLKVIAEGVEKRSQLNFLARAGCDAAQGYLLCPPMPVAELEHWLANRRKSPDKATRATSGSKRARPRAVNR
ncbi:MAG TPA: PAS domain-containing protein [Usitatibacter sp.]|nr:PAS domain-containing protein [Usitatibacter sp.]